MSTKCVAETVAVGYCDKVSVHAAIPDVIRLTIDEDVAMDVAPVVDGGRKVYVIMDCGQAKDLVAALLQAIDAVRE